MEGLFFSIKVLRSSCLTFVFFCVCLNEHLKKKIFEYYKCHSGRLPRCWLKRAFGAGAGQSTQALSGPLIKRENADCAELQSV